MTTTTTTIRDCAHCGDSITVTSRNPNRRFCSTRCRRTDWNIRHPDGRNNSGPNGDAVRGNDGVAGDGVRGNGAGVTGALRNDVPDAARPGNAVPRPNAVTRCPHCHKQVTVLTWLLPPAAAHVTPPAAPDHD